MATQKNATTSNFDFDTIAKAVINTKKRKTLMETQSPIMFLKNGV